MTDAQRQHRTSIDPFRIPAGTTTLFALLLLTVIASGLVSYTSVYAAIPSKMDRFFEVYNTCLAQEPILREPPRNFNEAAWQNDALYRQSRCVAPVYRDQALWIGYGMALLLGLAALLYWLQPLWTVRRRRLVELREEDGPQLYRELVALSRIAGLRRPPRFLVSADPRVNGQAFGRVGRRYVQLTAGLVRLYDSEPAQFRSVVRHELAHIRNRDVDLTAFTVALWRSCVAVALLPVAVVTVHPGVFGAPLRWRFDAQVARTGLALAVLAALMFLTRNALLRARELHADARMAGRGDDDTAPAVPQPGSVPARRPAVFDTHPSPRERAHALADPAAVLLRQRLWELFGVGIAVAIVAVSLRAFLGVSYERLHGVPFTAAGILAAPWLAVPLGIAVWRAVARNWPRVPPRREVLLPALVLAAGFLAGEQLALYTAQLSAPSADWSWLISGPVLAIGAMLLALWFAAAARAALAGTGELRRRRPVWAVIAAGSVGALAWFAGWYETHGVTGIALEPDALERTRWYSALANWSRAADSWLGARLVGSLALLCLVVICLVPLLFRGRPGYLRDLRTVVKLSLAGAAAFAVACLALALIVKANVPTDQRRQGAFLITTMFTFTAFAVLTQAAVAAVAAGMLRSYRALLVPLAVLLTGALTIVIDYVAVTPVSLCIDLYTNAARGCRPTLTVWGVTVAAEWTLFQGMLVALPAALIGAAVGGLVRRDGDARQAEPSSGRLRRLAPVAVAATLLAAVATAAVASIPTAYGRWWESMNVGLDAESPVPSPVLASIDPCLVGTWTETSREAYEWIDGTELHFTGRGPRHQFAIDGTAVVDFGTGLVERATHGGRRWTRTTTGTIRFTYENRNGQLIATDAAADGRVTVMVDGTVHSGRSLANDVQQRNYTCRGDRQEQVTNTGISDTSATLVRVDRATHIDPPTAVAANAECVVGTWRETSHEQHFTFNGEWVTQRSSGRVQRFHADGTGALDDGTGTTTTAIIDGRTVEWVYTGTDTFTYEVRGNRIHYANGKGAGDYIFKIDGRIRDSQPRDTVPQFVPDTYTCDGDTMTQTGQHYSIRLTRSR